VIKRINYTKRQKIKSEHIGVIVREVSGTYPIASVSVSLEEYKLPADAKVYVEAYRKASYMRVKLGTVAAHDPSRDFVMSEFASPEGVLFRVKVVGQSEGLTRNGPLLLAVADQISPSEGEEEDTEYEKLIRFVPEDLNGEIWRLDFEDGPMIQFERAYWEDRSSIVRSGWFFPLVLPTVLRESLRKALENDYRSTDDDDWRARWLRFAQSIPGDSSLPGEDDVEDWIDSKVAAFCRRQKMTDRFNPAVRQGGV